MCILHIDDSRKQRQKYRKMLSETVGQNAAAVIISEMLRDKGLSASDAQEKLRVFEIKKAQAVFTKDNLNSPISADDFI